MFKNTGLQGSTFSDPRMTMAFGPFELPTHGLLQNRQDHSPLKFCFVRNQLFGWHRGIHSAMNIGITKQIGGGVNGWSYYNIN